MVLLTINGLDVTGLVTINWDEATLSTEETGRDNVTGKMNVDAINQKVTLPCTFGRLTWAQASSILKALDANGINGNISCKYPDAKAGVFETKTFYVSDRQALAALVEGDEIFWDGLSFTLIEE